MQKGENKKIQTLQKSIFLKTLYPNITMINILVYMSFWTFKDVLEFLHKRVHVYIM